MLWGTVVFLGVRKRGMVMPATGCVRGADDGMMTRSRVMTVVHLEAPERESGIVKVFFG